MVLLISHIDAFDNVIETDVKKLTRSSKLKKLLDDLHNETGIPKTSIFALKNHSEGYELSLDTSIVVLKALRVIMNRILDLFDSKALQQNLM